MKRLILANNSFKSSRSEHAVYRCKNLLKILMIYLITQCIQKYNTLNQSGHCRSKKNSLHHFPDSRHIESTDSLLDSPCIEIICECEHRESFSGLLHLIVCKRDILRHIREGEHHRIVIFYEVIDFHSGIWRAHG